MSSRTVDISYSIDKRKFIVFCFDANKNDVNWVKIVEFKDYNEAKTFSCKWAEDDSPDW